MEKRRKSNVAGGRLERKGRAEVARLGGGGVAEGGEDDVPVHGEGRPRVGARVGVVVRVVEAHRELVEARLPEGDDVVEERRPREAENGVLVIRIKRGGSPHLGTISSRGNNFIMQSSIHPRHLQRLHGGVTAPVGEVAPHHALGARPQLRREDERDGNGEPCPERVAREAREPLSPKSQLHTERSIARSNAGGQGESACTPTFLHHSNTLYHPT